MKRTRYKNLASRSPLEREKFQEAFNDRDRGFRSQIGSFQPVPERLGANLNNNLIKSSSRIGGNRLFALLPSILLGNNNRGAAARAREIIYSLRRRPGGSATPRSTFCSSVGSCRCFFMTRGGPLEPAGHKHPSCSDRFRPETGEKRDDASRLRRSIVRSILFA